MSPIPWSTTAIGIICLAALILLAYIDLLNILILLHYYFILYKNNFLCI